MNILMVSNEFPPSLGGVQTHVYELSRALVLLGHQVDVITRLKDEDLPAFEDTSGVRIHRIPLAVNHLIYNWQLLKKIRSLVDNRCINVIHVHGMRPLAACKKLNLPVVFTNHTSSFLKRFEQGSAQRQKMLKLLQAVSMVIAPSQLLIDKTIQTGYRGTANFVPNGVDVGKFSPGDSSLRERLGLAESDFVVLFAGRLHKVKGVDCLAAAVEFAALPKLHLVVAGDGDERADLEKNATRHLGSDHVHMLGAVANPDMPDVYRGADVAVLPSLMEATSIAGLEAMACGLPLIGSRVGGLPYIIEEGRSGLLFEPGVPEDLGNTIRTLYEDRELTERMGRRSRQRVVELFSWEKIAAQTAELYRQTLATSR